jgi:hypothetical protein
MISIKPVPQNAFASIRDNLEPDSNVTEESEMHSEKQLSAKTSTDAGIWTNFKPVFENILVPRLSMFDSLSKTTDLSSSFFETLCDAINLVGDGSHRMLPEADPQPRVETHWITPSTTINRGQNSPEIPQTTWEVGELGFAIEFDLELKCGTFNEHGQVK